MSGGGDLNGCWIGKGSRARLQGGASYDIYGDQDQQNLIARETILYGEHPVFWLGENIVGVQPASRLSCPRNW